MSWDRSKRICGCGCSETFTPNAHNQKYVLSHKTVRDNLAKRTILEPKECVVCSKTFQPKSKRNIYCSTNCKLDNQNERERRTKELPDTVHLLQQRCDQLSSLLEREKTKSEIIIETIRAALAKEHKIKIKQPKPNKTKRYDQTFISLFSDVQIGQKVEAANVQGLSEYNFSIFKERYRKWLDKIIEFKQQDAKHLGLNTLIVNMLGDIVENECIYPAQAHHIDLTLLDQLVEGVRVISDGLLELGQYFNLIEIFQIKGNHGRLGKKGDYHEASNADTIFYLFLNERIKHIPHIKTYLSAGSIMLYEHKKHKFALMHGHEARSWGGIPYYGLDRVEKRLTGLLGIEPDYLFLGHHHDPSTLHEKTMINGSFVGGSDLSINQMFLNAVPSQRIFYLDPEHGINRQSSLWLDTKRVLEPNENGIYTPIRK